MSPKTAKDGILVVRVACATQLAYMKSETKTM